MIKKVDEQGAAASALSVTDDQKREAMYWQKNLQLMAYLLFVWFVVSFGCSIVFVDYLNQFRVAGYQLGFWFAQQGSIYVFVLLVFVYSWQMAKLDKKYSQAAGQAQQD